MRSRPRLRAAATALGATWLSVIPVPPTAQAQSGETPIYLGFTNKLDYRRLEQPGVQEEAFRNRMEVTASRGIFTAWVRLQSLQVSDATAYDPFGAGDGEITSEQRLDATEVTRRAITLDTDEIQATAGDFSYVFGRGLLLSVFEDEELNFDTRLEGIMASYQPGAGTVTALAGSRNDNRFRGAFVQASPRSAAGLGTVRGGAGFLEAWGGGEDTDVLDLEHHAGGFVEVDAGPATLYGEYVHRDFAGRNGRGASGDAGHGVFAAGILSAGSVTISGEFRDYEKFEHEFHDPPTTLRQHTWTLLNRTNGIVNTDIQDDGVQGYLLEGEYAYDYFTTIQGSFSKLDEDGTASDFWEAYAELKGNRNESVFVTAAFAESELRLGNTFEERISGFGEVVVEIDDLNSLSFGIEWSDVLESDELTQSFELPSEFRERIFSVSWARSPWLNLTATFEDTNEDDPAETDDRWLSVLAELAVSENHNVTASVGSERGGWKCTGGVCFFEPEFEGLKVNWVARY